MRHLLDIPDLPIQAFTPRPCGGMTLHGKSDAPPPPDYAGAANATAAGNLEASKYATKANRADQYTPYGSSTWQNIGDDRWAQSINLTPEGQALLDQQNKTSQNLANLQDTASARVAAQQGRGWNDGLIKTQGQAYNPYADTNTATQSIMARLNPQLDRRRASSETQLANQGIQRGSEAWRNAQTDLTEAENDAYSQASLQGIGLGIQQQNQTFGQSNALRNQDFQEQSYMASRDLNALNALRTGSQVTNPTFGGYAQQATTAGPDMLGAANSTYNAQLAANNAKNAGIGGLTSGLFGLGSAYLGGPAAAGLFGG